MDARQGLLYDSVVLHSPGMLLDCTAQTRSSLCAGLSTGRKPKTFFLADTTDSRLLVDPMEVTFEDGDSFTQYLRGSGIGALIDVTKDTDPTKSNIVTVLQPDSGNAHLYGEGGCLCCQRNHNIY